MGAPAGSSITATAAQNATGNTSEFSACVTVVAVTNPQGDLDGDGAVDQDDLNIVVANQGQCEQAPLCPWDCGNGDGNVAVVDFLTLLSQWGQTGTTCDFNGTGVGVVQFLALLAHWGPC